jgi:hypothetical protein
VSSRSRSKHISCPVRWNDTRLALVIEKGGRTAAFVDPSDLALTIPVQGQWRQRQRNWTIQHRWSNVREAWTPIKFPYLFRYTMLIALIRYDGHTTLVQLWLLMDLPDSAYRKGCYCSCALATIILPRRHAIRSSNLYNIREARLGGDCVALVVPPFCCQCLQRVILRTFIMTIPREMD